MTKSKKPKLRFRFRRHHSERPLHKRVALHPLSIFLVLCAGVLIVASTWRAGADTLEVTAKVPAPLPAGPAIITSPHDQDHLTETPITVAGTCPDNTYVKLYRDDVFSGVSQCVGGHFSISTSLADGANKLQAKVYNITDDEGPASAPIIVYYDRPVTPTPSAPTGQAPPVTSTPSGSGAISGTGNGPLVITGDYQYQAHYTGQPFSWKFQVSGGARPYTITITWGDGETTTFQSQDGILNLSHAYKKGGDYQPILHVTDADGATVQLQLSAVVKDWPIIAVTTMPFGAEIERYLWALWPAYLAILLMLASFWLGELEVVHYIWMDKVRGKRRHKRRHV